MVPTTRRVTSADGTTLLVEEAGNREAPALVFLHGIAQSRASFRSVLDGPLARDHHLVAFDLRGHGDSDKPGTADAYAGGARLGEDLAAVLAGLDHPTIIAWSYGGVVVGEYLRLHGDVGLGAVVFVGAAVKLGKAAKGLLGPTMLENGRGLVSDDPATYLATSRTFLEGCLTTPHDVAPLVAEMQRVPTVARRALLTRTEDFAPELAASKVPFTTIHGAKDTVILPAMSEAIAAARPATRATVLANAGHAPWIDDPPAFESALRGLR